MPRTPALFFLAMVALLLAPLPHGAAQSARRASSEKPDLPEGIRAGYRTLSQAMRDEDLAALMGLFHRNFIFEEEDSSTLDRGPWRRRWAELFDRYHFSRAAFEPTGILRQEEGRMVVRTRSVVVRDEERKDVTDLRETYLEDTWVEDDGSWTLIYRREPEVVTQGVVADGDARGGRASPRIARLRKSLATGEEGAIERFIGEVEAAGGILVETVESDAETRLVTFVFRGEGAERRVSVRGGRSTSTDVKELQQLGDTGVWYRTERVPARSRFTYEYVIDKAVTLAPSGGEPAETFIARLTSPDPLNPRTLDGLSLASLPDAPTPEWLGGSSDAPRGEVERKQMRSRALGERRFVTVYTPPELDDEAKLPAAFLLDGGDYSSRRKTGEILDRLIAQKAISPVIVLMIHDEGSLRPELEPTPEMLRFLGEEVVAWARESYPITDDPKRTIIGGNRIGGGLAALVALEHPEVFGAVVIESGDLSICPSDAEASAGPCVPRRFRDTPKAPLAFSIDVGIFEGEPVVETSRHLRDVLIAKGYEVRYRETPSNQSSIAWWEALVRGLEASLAE